VLMAEVSWIRDSLTPTRATSITCVRWLPPGPKATRPTACGTTALGARHAPTVGILMCADRDDTVVRYALSGAAQPTAVAGYTYDTLPPAERAALPSDTRVAAALEAPVDVDGRQMTLAEYLESVARL